MRNHDPFADTETLAQTIWARTNCRPIAWWQISTAEQNVYLNTAAWLVDRLPAVCPECRQPTIRTTTQTDELGVTHNMQVCTGGHLWETRWIRDKEAAT